MEKILVTGCAGFIGMNVCESILKEGSIIHGIDNLNNYYDPKLKKDRIKKLIEFENFKFSEGDIVNIKFLEEVFQKFKPDKVLNLAAQAGVRYSLENPHTYIQSNIVGFMNILECCRQFDIEGLVYASSSSVYGNNKSLPFSEFDKVDSPISIYACSKKANELMAHSYSQLFNLNTTGLRFFTVYGPWGRPDMAMYIFAKKIKSGEQISVYNYGKMERDFTFIDDIVDGIKSALKNNYQCEIFNLGNNRSEDLLDMIKIIEKEVGKEAKINFEKIQLGDVKSTYANIDYSREMLSYNPKTSINEGIPKFVEWFLKYTK